jgi:alkylation response protein AidB-like acyl-CoA dehydrogenase
VDEMTEDYAFSDEQHALREAVRRFARTHYDEASCRQAMESELGHNPAAWRRLGTELGLLGLGVPDADGGTGGSIVDAAIAVEELGAALATGPFFGTTYLGIPLLAACPAGPERNELLAALCAGDVTATTLSAPSTSVTVSESDAGWRLDGDLGPVVDAPAVDVLLLTAVTPGGTGLFSVSLDQGGVDVERLVSFDHTRRLAAVRLSGAEAVLLAEEVAAEEALEAAAETGRVLLAAEQLGAAQHLLSLSLEHARTRIQFGRPIGSFQAVKHRLADMLVLVEHGRSACYHAAWALARGDDARLAASIAQAACSAMFSKVAADTIQVHGGVGFTWEHQAHLYFKRAAADAALLGSAEWHRDRVAGLVLDHVVDAPAPPVARGRALAADSTAESS